MSVAPGIAPIGSTRADDLEIQAREDDRAALGSFLRDGVGYETVSLESLELFVAQQKSVAENAVKGRSMTTLVGAAASKDEQTSLEATAALEAYVRLHPESARELLPRMKAYDLAGKRIIGALSHAGVLEGQETLGEMLRDRRVSAEAREDAAAALAMAENPQRESLEAVRAMMNDKDARVSSASTLAAGNLARGLAEMDADAANDAVTDLLARLDIARDDADVALLLRALGNAGDARVVPYAERYLASTNPGLRAAACDALTFVKGPAADELLVRAMLRDEDGRVRVDAIRVTVYRSFDSFASALALAGSKDAETAVRLAVLDRCGAAMNDPRALAIVKNAAENDANEDVKETAKHMLAIPR
jgi:hypothetical protein